VKLFQFKPVVLDNYLRTLLNSNKDTVYNDMNPTGTLSDSLDTTKLLQIFY